MWTLACQDKWPLAVLFAKFLPCLELGELKAVLLAWLNLSSCLLNFFLSSTLFMAKVMQKAVRLFKVIQCTFFCCVCS